jgi:hypothetical protein
LNGTKRRCWSRFFWIIIHSKRKTFSRKLLLLCYFKDFFSAETPPCTTKISSNSFLWLKSMRSFKLKNPIRILISQSNSLSLHLENKVGFQTNPHSDVGGNGYLRCFPCTQNLWKREFCGKMLPQCILAATHPIFRFAKSWKGY